MYTGAIGGSGRGKLGRIRVSPEIDDLLDWLEIEYEDTEYDLLNGAVESLSLLAQRLQRYVRKMAEIIGRCRACHRSGMDKLELEARLRSELRFDFAEDIYIDAALLNDYLVMTYGRTNTIHLSMSGVSAKKIRFYALVKRKLRLNLLDLLMQEAGVSMLESIGLENVSYNGAETLCEVEEKLSGIFGFASC